jgi:hypothetical protein
MLKEGGAVLRAEILEPQTYPSFRARFRRSGLLMEIAIKHPGRLEAADAED